MMLKLKIGKTIKVYNITGVDKVLLYINGYKEEELKSENSEELKEYIKDCINDYNVTSIMLQDNIAYIEALYY